MTKSNTFVCSSCKETFNLAGDMPELHEGEQIICGDCYSDMMNSLNTFFSNGLSSEKETIH